MDKFFVFLGILFGGFIIYCFIAGILKSKKIDQGIIKVQFEGGVPGINQGKVTLKIHKDHLTLNDTFLIPYTRIKGASVFSGKDIISQEKSVIGRAAIGGLLLGPLGAAIGGMSGIGDKQKIQKKHFMSILFRGKDGSDQQLLVSDEDGKGFLRDFAQLVNKRLNITVPHEI